MKFLLLLLTTLTFAEGIDKEKRDKILSESDRDVQSSINIYGSHSANHQSKMTSERESLNVRGFCKEKGFMEKSFDYILDLISSVVDVSNEDVPLKCLKKYTEMYSDDELNINMAYGYLDARSEVYDIAKRDIFIDEITRSCRGDNFSCGFTQDEEDAEIFTRTVEDVYGNEKKVKLRLTHAAASTSEKVNRSKSLGKLEQTIQTEISEDNNFGAIADGAEVVIYNGHSRDGGGPSFEPPKVKNRHTDYDWYRKERPGFKRVLKELKKSKKDPQLMAFISCSSEKHFYDQLKKAAPNTGYVMSKDVGYFTNLNAVALSTIDSVLGLKCKKGFENNIEKSGHQRNNWVLNDFFKS